MSRLSLSVQQSATANWSNISPVAAERSGGRGQEVVSLLAFNSDGPSSNPADVYSFSVKFVFEKNENKQKEAGIDPFLKIDSHSPLFAIKIILAVQLNNANNPATDKRENDLVRKKKHAYANLNKG